MANNHALYRCSLYIKITFTGTPNIYRQFLFTFLSLLIYYFYSLHFCRFYPLYFNVFSCYKNQ